MEENRVVGPCEMLLIGGSAGSLEVIFRLLPLLKTGLHFPVIVVLHRRYSSDSSLIELLASKTINEAFEVEDKEPIKPGNIYLAPADYHLLVESNQTFSLDYSEKINFSRPSIDVSFESAVEIYGSKVVALLLSGANEDGTAGLRCIKKAGGRTVAQDPETAQMPFMPQHAILQGIVDYVLDVNQMAEFINHLR